VLIHADGGSYKPLNWMSPPCKLTEEDGVWRVVKQAGEELRITIEEVLSDSSHELGQDPGLIKDGVEAHLQELSPSTSPPSRAWTLVRREYPTAIGPVDLLSATADGKHVASRSSAAARSTGVEQLTPVRRTAEP